MHIFPTAMHSRLRPSDQESLHSRAFIEKDFFFIFLFFLPVMYDSIGKLRFTEYSVETTAQRRQTTKIKVFSSSLPTGAERWTRVG